MRHFVIRKALVRRPIFARRVIKNQQCREVFAVVLKLAFVERHGQVKYKGFSDLFRLIASDAVMRQCPFQHQRRLILPFESVVFVTLIPNDFHLLPQADARRAFRQFLAKALLVDLGHRFALQLVTLVQEGQPEGETVILRKDF